MRLVTAGLVTLLPIAACSSGSKKHSPDAAPDNGFNKPTASLHANMQISSGNWMDLGPADLSCLNTASSDVATTQAITFNTTVKDFQSGNNVPNATVIAFKDVNYMTKFDMQTSSSTGAITFTIPQGTKRFGFEMTTSDGSTLPTFLLNQVLASPSTTPQMGDKIQSVSSATAATLPALIGETRTDGTGVLAGALRDCQHHEISNFIATVSSTSMTTTQITGEETFYFTSSVDLPVHHCDPAGCKSSQLDASSADGLFMVIQLPVTPTAYVQMWGYPTDADVTAGNLKLISQLQVPVLSNTVITGSYEPLRQ